jgi:hypothetical protein
MSRLEDSAIEIFGFGMIAYPVMVQITELREGRNSSEH